jgi:hypothetical protein
MDKLSIIMQVGVSAGSVKERSNEGPDGHASGGGTGGGAAAVEAEAV